MWNYFILSDKCKDDLWRYYCGFLNNIKNDFKQKILLLGVFLYIPLIGIHFFNENNRNYKKMTRLLNKQHEQSIMTIYLLEKSIKELTKQIVELERREKVIILQNNSTNTVKMQSNDSLQSLNEECVNSETKSCIIINIEDECENKEKGDDEVKDEFMDDWYNILSC